MVMNILRSKKFAKRVLIALLIVIIPAFVLWGAGSITKKPPLVGTIDGQKISADVFEKSLQGIRVQVLLTHFGNLDNFNKILQNRQLVNQLAWERLIYLNAARANKINVTNQDVMGYLARHPLFQRNGTFDKQSYDYILRNNLSLDPRRFEDLIRENLQVQVLQQELLKDTYVSDEELLAYFKKTNDSVDLSYVLIDKDPYSQDVVVSGEEVEQFYAANKQRFFTPAKVEVEYVEFPYEDETQKKEVLETLKKVFPELKGSPEKFAETANQYGLSYGTSGPFAREEVVSGITFFKGFNDTAFQTADGEVSYPVFSSPQKGAAYVIRRTGGIPSTPLAFEEVRDGIATALKDSKSIQLSLQKAAEIQGKLAKEEITLEEAANSLEQDVQTTGPVSFQGYIENLGPANRLVILALETGEGKMVSPVATKKGALLVRVDSITPADETLFEQQKEQLKKNLLSQKQISVMNNWMRENAAKVQLNRPLNEV